MQGLGIDTTEINPQFDVDVYRIVYRTVNWDNTEIQASGALLIPKGQNAPALLGSYQHGTIANDADIPSRQGYELPIGLAFASTGAVVTMPDYLGFGADAQNLHPYVHAKSEATATVDILRAARRYASQNGLTLKEKVVLFGYSQGGHATAATVREIEKHHGQEFKILGAAPMSGPYDLAGAQVDLLLSDAEYSQPFYLPYVLFSYNMVYNMYPEGQASYLKPEYVNVLYDALVSNSTPDFLNSLMPKVPKRIILDSQVQAFIDNPKTHPLRLALEANDLKSFTPRSPMLVLYCEGDDEVPYQHAINATNAWRQQGAPNLLSESMGANNNHADCVLPSLRRAFRWIKELEAAE
jgi:acetyl esterase/lipase